MIKDKMKLLSTHIFLPSAHKENKENKENKKKTNLKRMINH